MEEKKEWMENFFNALTSKRISRNKNFESFSSDWSRTVLRRFRTVCALKMDAKRLARIPGTFCWISREHSRLTFHLECPKLSYKRMVTLQGFEWEWLGGDEEIQSLLAEKALETMVL